MSFLNPLMLLGLLGVALPILVHLLSRKRHDVVLWGAMQFLDVGRFAKRRLRLQELLLLLLRVGLIALVALALARPWAVGSLFASFASSNSRDMVFVIDGSYSTGWQKGDQTPSPHAWANQWVHQFLEHLQPGDQAALIDAREQPRAIVEPLTGDFRRIREELNRLPAPAGSVNWSAAIAAAFETLTTSARLDREIIVLTDGQSQGWSAGDDALWARIDELRKLAPVPPNVWVVQPGPEDTPAGPNVSLGKLQASPELSVSGLPVQFKTTVRLSGGDEPLSRRVYFEVDGQRLPEKTQQIELQPDGEAGVEFEHQFDTLGSHVVSVTLDADNLPGDDRADVAIAVTDAIPVLLVDGNPLVDPTRSEAFFAKAALSPSLNDSPWVHARVIPWDRLDGETLGDAQVVILANVLRVTDEQSSLLKSFLQRGGGLLLALGDRVDANAYNRTLLDDALGVMAASLGVIKQNEFEETAGAHVANDSLDIPWMARFRSDNGGGLAGANFQKWWQVELDSDDSNGRKSTDSPARPVPVTLARLDTGDPLLLSSTYGPGRVMLLASPLDADWSNLPVRPDYVALLHEIVFHLGTGSTSRNVDVGSPLVQPVGGKIPSDNYVFFGPGDTSYPAVAGGDERSAVVTFSDTYVPGVYVLRPKKPEPAVAGDWSPEYFVVNFDRRESNLAPLSASDRANLESNGRLAFVSDEEDLRQRSLSKGAGFELWRLLLLLVLLLLAAEVLLTRSLVAGALDSQDSNDFGNGKGEHHESARQPIGAGLNP